jgi:HAD superfamily hydrolase (TIGR01549 family)
LLMEYFRVQGWASRPWEHAALYDVFAAHGHEFASGLGSEDLRPFARRIIRTLFQRLAVEVDTAVADAHAVALWRILGPEHLTTFPDAAETLRQLRASGYRLAVISNWQHGLRTFCDALGMGEHLDIVVASAEVGAAKPDARIYSEACRQLTLAPDRVLHVGDSHAEDVLGARAAGLQALWLSRARIAPSDPDTVHSLNQVLERLLPA